MHDGKYQCHMAASCTYHLPSSPSCSTRAIQKSITLYEKYLRVFLEKKSGEWTISRKMTRKKGQEAEAEKTRGEIGKGNQMMAQRFQTGREHEHPQPPFGVNSSTRNLKEIE